MGTKEDIINALRPIFSLGIGILIGYVWYIYQEGEGLLIPVLIGLFTAIFVYALITEKRMSSDIAKAGRAFIGVIFGLFIGYQVYLYTEEEMYGVISAIIAIPLSVFLLSQLDKAGGD